MKILLLVQPWLNRTNSNSLQEKIDKAFTLERRGTLLTNAMFKIEGIVRDRLLKVFAHELVDKANKWVVEIPRPRLLPHPEDQTSAGSYSTIHVRAVVTHHQPDIVLAFGTNSVNAMVEYGEGCPPTLRSLSVSSSKWRRSMAATRDSLRNFLLQKEVA